MIAFKNPDVPNQRLNLYNNRSAFSTFLQAGANQYLNFSTDDGANVPLLRQCAHEQHAQCLLEICFTLPLRTEETDDTNKQAAQRPGAVYTRSDSLGLLRHRGCGSKRSTNSSCRQTTTGLLEHELHLVLENGGCYDCLVSLATDLFHLRTANHELYLD